MKKKVITIIIIAMFPVFSLSASWKYFYSKDEMTGKVSYYATSPSVTATKRMAFPYTGTKGWIGIGCSNNRQWVYFGFSDLNIMGQTIEDGYSITTTRAKTDSWNNGKTGSIRLTQEFGSRFLHVSEFDELSGKYGIDMLVNSLSNSSYFLLELRWFGNGDVYFKFPLKGASKAIAKMHKQCGYKSFKKD